MHILIALATMLGGAVFWIYRMRAAADAATDLADMAGDVLSAARRFGFRRRYDMHPVDSIDDPMLAAGALTVAFLGLGAAATAEERALHVDALQRHLRASAADAEEMLVLGQWFVYECNGPAPAVSRLGKRLMKLSGSDALDAPLHIIGEVASAQGGLIDCQRDALNDLRILFRR